MRNRLADVTTRLQRLTLPAMAENVSDVARTAARSGRSHAAFLHELARLEWETREQRRIDRHLRESGLPRDKTVHTLDLAACSPLIRQQLDRLRSGAFVQQAINVVAVGRPGAGKSHLLASLGHSVIQQGTTVLWQSTAQLVQRLLAAKRDLRLPQELAKLDRVACLMLDDSGYVQHDQDEMEVLCTLLRERYERKRVLISTNLVFSAWTRIFKRPMTTLAAIDRVVQHAVILDLMQLERYRAKEATAAQRPATTTSPPLMPTPPAPS